MAAPVGRLLPELLGSPWLHPFHPVPLPAAWRLWGRLTLAAAQIDLSPCWLDFEGGGAAVLAVGWGRLPRHHPPPEVPRSIGSLEPPWAAVLSLQ